MKSAKSCEILTKFEPQWVITVGKKVNTPKVNTWIYAFYVNSQTA